MCFSCGCTPHWGLLEDDHGDGRNITTATLKGAAEAAGTDVAHVVANIVMGLSHYDPNYVPPGNPSEAIAAAKSVESIEDFLETVTFKEADIGTEVAGTVVKSNDEDHFLLMVAYDPHRMPLRGADKRIDIASPRVLEKGCWRYMAKGAKTGMWHQPGHADEAICVENYIYRNPVPWVIKSLDGRETVIKEGCWMVGFILGNEAWALYKSGRIGGVSMQGGAARTLATPESLARIGSET